MNAADLSRSTLPIAPRRVLDGFVDTLSEDPREAAAPSLLEARGRTAQGRDLRRLRTNDARLRRRALRRRGLPPPRAAPRPRPLPPKRTETLARFRGHLVPDLEAARRPRGRSSTSARPVAAPAPAPISTSTRTPTSCTSSTPGSLWEVGGVTPPSPLSPLVRADREMPHEPSRLLVAGDLHADESWFENLVYYAREQRCQAILQLGDLGYWPRIKHYDDFLRTLPRQLEGADLDLYFVEGNHEDLDACGVPKLGHVLQRRRFAGGIESTHSQGFSRAGRNRELAGEGAHRARGVCSLSAAGRVDAPPVAPCMCTSLAGTTTSPPSGTRCSSRRGRRRSPTRRQRRGTGRPRACADASGIQRRRRPPKTQAHRLRPPWQSSGQRTLAETGRGTRTTRLSC